MFYVLLEWSHKWDDEPVQIWSELDDQRCETRKIEVFSHGFRLTYDHEDPRSAAGLADVPFPEDLRKLNAAGPFHASSVSQSDFEGLWSRSIESPSDPFPLFF